MGSGFKKIVVLTAAVIIATAVFFLRDRDRFLQSPLVPLGDPERKKQISESQTANYGKSALLDAATSPPPPSSLNPKITILREIFASRNDNDPRMDSELKVLDEQTKAELRREYLGLPKEKLNERGTIVFLLGRNLTKPQDFEFMTSVISESACRSLENCARDETAGVDAEHLHHESGTEITLAYPQVVVIKSTENFLRDSDRSHLLFPQARELVENAKKSPIEPVRTIAERIRF